MADVDIGGYALGAIGLLWLIAVAGMFATGICESARPKPLDGEKEQRGVALLIGGVASLVTPILLFIHAFWAIAGFEGLELTPDLLIDLIIARQVVVLGVFAFLVAVSIIASIIGWTIRAAAPAIGKRIGIAAVPLALGTLALTIFATYEVVARVINLATPG